MQTSASRPEKGQDSAEAPARSRNGRRFAGTSSSGRASSGKEFDDLRSPGDRDRDRVVYSSAFRRLAGITQVASPTELYPVHNRLIHSLKVAQVGRNLARTLMHDDRAARNLDAAGGVDADVVEAAALAHDLGHPPFGHVTERTLDDLLTAGGEALGVSDGYNGNAQSFRIVTTLAVSASDSREERRRGLNLTRATLNAILKYPWRREAGGARHANWGVYDSEDADFSWCRRGATPVLDGKTIEAALMDWADDITYAVYDLEDFFRAGLIPLDRLTSDPGEQERFMAWALASGKVGAAEIDRLKRAFLSSPVVQPGLPGPFRGGRADRAALRNLTSALIRRYINLSMSLESLDGRIMLAIDPEIRDEVRMLKLLTWHYVIESPALRSRRDRQRALITSLFTTFGDAASGRGGWNIFPEYFQEALEEADGDGKAVKRIVADLIASMSEGQAVALHRRLTGDGSASAWDPDLL
ncbi:MAG: deoxyguanosinetriphosphate triphosphohydrolase family protein [Thermomicrobiales bacterium]